MVIIIQPLLGVINALYNMGHAVLPVERALPNPDLQPADTKKKAKLELENKENNDMV